MSTSVNDYATVIVNPTGDTVYVQAVYSGLKPLANLTDVLGFDPKTAYSVRSIYMKPVEYSKFIVQEACMSTKSLQSYKQHTFLVRFL